MPEPRIIWGQRVRTDEPIKVQGALSAMREMLRTMPRDGEWYRCILPCKGSSSAASQAKNRLEIEYGTNFEFRTQKKDGCRWLLARYKADDE